MEYVPFTLEDLMTDQNFFRNHPEAIRQVMYQLMHGLNFLHNCGIIHRDIKPGNIMVHFNQNGTLQVKIIDFSISKAATDQGVDILNDLFTKGILDLQSNRYTKNVTTRPYRAPEVALMLKYDEKIDIWAAGCIFAEILQSLVTHRRQLLFKAFICMPLSPVENAE